MPDSNIRIIQASLPGTGSTFVANLLAGLVCPEEAIAFPAQSKIGTSLLTKTHEKEPLSFFSDYPAYAIYMVITTRQDRKQYGPKVHTHPRVLNIPYEDILVTSDRSLEATVRALVDRLLLFLPTDILPDGSVDTLQAKTLSRIKGMNQVVEKLSDQPFSVCDTFYHIHGSHRDRARKRREAKETQLADQDER